MTAVSKAWSRITRWYAQNVPDDKLILPAGASEEELADVQSQMNVRFTDDLLESFRLHNGTNEQSIFPYAFYLLSLEEIVSQWRMWQKGLDDGAFDDSRPAPAGPIKKVWWDTRWIPLTHNSGGDHHCFDSAPARGGMVGQIIQFSHEVGPQHVVANSLVSWLTSLADDLENHRYQYDDYECCLIPNE